MNKQKLRNYDAWYAIGGSIGIVVINLAALILELKIANGNILVVIPFILGIIALGISIIGLYLNRKPQRDGIFSGVFIAHIIVAVLISWATLVPTFGVVILILACVFDSLYEGLGNAKDKRGENPFADENILNVTERY